MVIRAAVSGQVAQTRALKAAITEAYALAASAIDLDQLTGAIDTGNRTAIDAVLGIVGGLSQPLLNQLSGNTLELLLAAVMAAMTAFAVEHRSRVQLEPATIAAIRLQITADVIRPLAVAAASAALGLVASRTGLRADETALAIAVSFALSRGQSLSVEHFRKALSEARRSPGADNSGDTTVLGPASAKVVMQRYQTGLNAAQRSSLRVILATGVDDAIIASATARQTRALASYRMSSIAERESQRAANAGAYLAFVQGKQNSSLPRTARRFWATAGDERVRHSHSAIPGMNPGGVDINQSFETPLGSILYPPLEANCRCKVAVRWPELA